MSGVSGSTDSTRIHNEDIPSGERCDDTKGAASSQKRSVGCSVAVHQVCEGEEQECQIKREEEREEGDSGSEGADEQQEGEDEPAKEVQ